MIKDDGSFDKESCRVFGLGAHTLAALMAAVVHNLEQTPTSPRPEQQRQHPGPPQPDKPRHHRISHTNPGTPINQPRPIPHRREPPVEPNASATSHLHHHHP